MSHWLKKVLVGAALGVTSCARITALETEVTTLKKVVKQQELWTHRELRKLAARALCKEDVTDFIEQCENGSCPTQKGEHVLRFMTAQPHAVLYLSSADDLSRIPDFRIDRLRKLADERSQLFTSKYLVVARTQNALLHPKPPLPPRGKGKAPLPTPAESKADHDAAVQRAQADAEQRANLVKEEILIKKIGIPEGKILGPHVFPFCAKPEEIDKTTVGLDVPQVNEPKDLDLGVWVFHVDC